MKEMKLVHSHPADSRDRINKIDRIPNQTRPVSILLILSILSKILDSTLRTTVRLPGKLGSFFPRFFRYGMAGELVFGLAAAWCLTGRGLASEPLAAEGGRTNVTVEVLIFSGRPNPYWPLQDTTRLETVKAKLSNLPEALKEEPAEWSRLGFAGFRIRGGETLGLPGEIRIYQGVIKLGQGKAAKYLKDTTGLEQGLINESKKVALEPPVRDAIASYETARKGAP